MIFSWLMELKLPCKEREDYFSGKNLDAIPYILFVPFVNHNMTQIKKGTIIILIN